MFIVIELQTNAAGVTSHIVTDHETKAEAESKFHTILSFAAVSNVPIHGAVILTADGVAQKSQCYRHETE